MNVPPIIPYFAVYANPPSLWYNTPALGDSFSEEVKVKPRIVPAILCIVVLTGVLAGCGRVSRPGSEETPPTAPDLPPSMAVTATGTPVAAPFQSPTPTDEPTAAATPIVYVIQSGDTLSGIAATYGVSVEALQAANGIANPLLLQVGQELVIPVGGVGATAFQPGLLMPTPTPMPIGIRGVGFYETAVGSLDCLGEVVNTSASTLTNVQVQVTLYDAVGNPLISGDGFVSADILPSAARLPFRILFISPPPAIASNQVTLLRADEAGELAARTIPLTVEEVSGVPSGPQFEVTGSVRNGDPAQTANSAMVIATAYDANGRVIGFRQQVVDVGNGLAPGGTAPFRMLLIVYGGPPTDFAVIAFGQAR